MLSSLLILALVFNTLLVKGQNVFFYMSTPDHVFVAYPNSKLVGMLPISKFTWGVTNAASTNHYVGSAAEPSLNFDQIKITRTVDVNSPILFGMVTKGTVFTKLILSAHVIQQGTNLNIQPLFSVTLSKAMVASITISGNSGAPMVETILFSYQAILEQGDNGKVSIIQSGFNLQNNQVITTL